MHHAPDFNFFFQQRPRCNNGFFGASSGSVFGREFCLTLSPTSRSKPYLVHTCLSCAVPFTIMRLGNFGFLNYDTNILLKNNKLMLSAFFLGRGKKIAHL
jgi:hypothetical protein